MHILNSASYNFRNMETHYIVWLTMASLAALLVITEWVIQTCLIQDKQTYIATNMYEV